MIKYKKKIVFISICFIIFFIIIGPVQANFFQLAPSENSDKITHGIDNEPDTHSSTNINPEITKINGIYYYRDDDLNQPMSDEGTILRKQPYENESIFCGMYILLHFNEHENYNYEYKIENIYYHIWQQAPFFPFQGEVFDIGYSTFNDHNWQTNESIQIDTSQCIVEVENYRLVQALQYTNPNISTFTGEEIYNFTIKSVGNNPAIRSNPNQYSFIIINIPDNETLQKLDSDKDHLSDYEELFVYFTNPYDRDTDNDKMTDFEEATDDPLEVPSTDPNNPYDQL